LDFLIPIDPAQCPGVIVPLLWQANGRPPVPTSGWFKLKAKKLASEVIEWVTQTRNGNLTFYIG
jgi:hypothetical protein